jgi:hypothetical protein
LLSQVLTLYTTPVVYLYLDRLSKRLGRRSGAVHLSHAQRLLDPEPEPESAAD